MMMLDGHYSDTAVPGRVELVSALWDQMRCAGRPLGPSPSVPWDSAGTAGGKQGHLTCSGVWVFSEKCRGVQRAGP